MSAKDSSGADLAVGNNVQTIAKIAVPNKGEIPAGTTLTVKAFGRSPNHIDVMYQDKVWYIDAKSVKKA